MRAASWSLLLIACAPTTAPPPEEAVTIVVAPSPARAVAIDASAPDAATAPSPIVNGRMTSPLDVPARDVRTTAPRSKALLLMELQQLDALFSSMPTNAPDAPMVLRRMADDYLELHRADSGVAGARRAIDNYAKVISNYPTAPQIDQSMYSLALEYELIGEDTNARKAYYELIVKQPTSKWIPYAYFAFGELFLREAKSDPSKWDLAKQAYMEVLKYPGALTPWTNWRLMQIARVTGNTAQALTYESRLRSGFPQSDAMTRIGETL